MITFFVNSENGVVKNDVAVDRISDLLKEESTLLWVDVSDPTEDDIDVLIEEFKFHPLAIEDATRHRQRAKLDTYEDYFFILFYCLSESEATGVIEPSQIGLFIGPNYMVTVHEGQHAVLHTMKERWNQNVRVVGERSVGLLLYSLLDAIVDDYFPVIDEISERIEDLEEKIFESFDHSAQRELFRLKKDLQAIRRAISPERDVMNVLVRRDTPIFDSQTTIVYFQDVYDHILRVTDAVDTFRDLLSSALDAYLSITSNRLNQVMKTLTASSIILMSMTLVASIYGMNFDHMPELHWHYGYAYALALMIAIGVTVTYLFRRIDWL